MEYIKSVKGFEGRYSITRDGRLWSHKWGIFIGCKSAYGYLRASLPRGDGTYKTVYLHRLVAEAFIPNPDGKPCVNHKDSNRENNRVDNLEWVTHQENTVHMHTNGRANQARRGMKNGNARYTEEQIKQVIESPLPPRKAAKVYGVSHSYISKLRAGQYRGDEAKIMAGSQG